jgi:hypothetical protein
LHEMARSRYLFRRTITLYMHQSIPQFDREGDAERSWKTFLSRVHAPSKVNHRLSS